MELYNIANKNNVWLSLIKSLVKLNSANSSNLHTC